MNNKLPEVKEVFSDIFSVLSRLEPKPTAHKDKLKNVTPKVPVQSIDHSCNDGASEPEWEQ